MGRSTYFYFVQDMNGRGWDLASPCANATVVKAMALASAETFSLANGLTIVMADTGPNKLVAL
jgi:hypothetical protein